MQVGVGLGSATQMLTITTIGVNPHLITQIMAKTLNKLDIETFDFKYLSNLTDVEFLNWIKEVKLHQHYKWFLPQLVAQLSGWEPVLDDLGNPLVKETFQHNKVRQDPKQLTLWRFSRILRSELITKQIDQPQYAKLTPLILLAMRNQHGIKYNQWRRDPNLEHILEPDLYMAVNHSFDNIGLWYGLGSQRLLEIRELGLMTKSGATLGQLKSPHTTWSLTGIQGTELDGLPKLTQTILTQIWLAHPENRHHNMILDLLDWDRMPDPLVSGEIFQRKQVVEPKQPKNAFDLSWL